MNLGDGIYGADDFIEFDAGYWTGVEWDLLNAATGPWTELGRENTHPNGINSAPGEEHWTIRRWVSDRDADVVIGWHMRKDNPNGGGVSGALFLNGEELDRATIAGQDSSGVSRAVAAAVKAGDAVDLALGPTGLCGDPNDGSDGSVNILTIYAAATPGVPRPATLIADSQAGWSTTGTQGENGWYYGYYDQRADLETRNGTYQAADFIEFLNAGGPIDPASNHWDGVKWDLADNVVLGTGPWTEISCGGAHPAGNGQGEPSVHWAVRRWQSDFDGEVRIQGFFLNPGAGDGVVGRVFVRDEEVFSRTSDGAGVSFNVSAQVKPDDTMDFAIGANGAGNLGQGGLDAVTDGSDGTLFEAAILAVGSAPTTGPVFRRGDIDQNGAIEITDAINLLAFLFQGGGTPRCQDAGDADDSGSIDITDAVNLLGYLFLGAEAPPAPGPEVCGVDPTDDPLPGPCVYEPTANACR